MQLSLVFGELHPAVRRDDPVFPIVQAGIRSLGDNDLSRDVVDLTEHRTGRHLTSIHLQHIECGDMVARTTNDGLLTVRHVVDGVGLVQRGPEREIITPDRPIAALTVRDPDGPKLAYVAFSITNAHNQ
jgi:hypothetical protein